MSTDDTVKRADQPMVDSTLEEHRACMDLVADVEACLDREADREGRWIGDLVEKLPQLAERMREHFRSEESGPMFASLPVQYPHLADRLAKLQSEHRTLLETIDRVIQRASALNLEHAERYEIRELHAEVQLMIATIRRHEAEENEAVLAAHWDEVGTGD